MSEPLYHGTDELSQIDIVENGIKLNRNKAVGDFGFGFYLTPELQSAKGMALRKAFVLSKPGIVELVLKKNFAEKVKVKNFGNLDILSKDDRILEWAQFIVNNRNGMEYIKCVSSKHGLGDNNLGKRYDIIIGSTADGSITQIARKCLSEKRIITIHEAKKLLDKSFGLQYCISTEKGLSAIDGAPRKKGVVSWR